LQEEMQGREISRLKKFGLPVQVVKGGTIADVLISIVELGKVTGRERQAAFLVSRLNAQLKGRSVSFGQIIARRPKVLVLVGYQPLVVGGRNSFIDEIIRYAGAENIAGSSRVAYPHYSFEELIRIDPEYLVIPRGLVPLRELQSDGRWKKLAAVRYDKVLFIDPDVISRPGPRVGEAVERISRFVYR
jgi:iron complex transport system substrate-binding protein